MNKGNNEIRKLVAEYLSLKKRDNELAEELVKWQRRQKQILEELRTIMELSTPNVKGRISIDD